MTETMIFQAACRRQGGISDIYAHAWELTNDTEMIAATPDEDIIWASDIDSLKMELERRHPPPHPDTTFLTVDNYHNLINVRIDLEILTDDPATIRAIAMVHSPITCNARTSRNAAHMCDALRAYVDCTASIESGWLYRVIVRYDPAGVKRRRQARERRRRNDRIKRDDVCQLAIAFSGIFRASSIGRKKLSAACTLESAVKKLIVDIAIFNRLYGKKAHRRFAKFQNFAIAWKARAVNNGTVFTCVPSMKKFSDWMDKECLARFRKPAAKWPAIETELPI